MKHLVVQALLIGCLGCSNLHASHYTDMAKEAIRLNLVVSLVQENEELSTRVQQLQRTTATLTQQVNALSPLEKTQQAKIESLQQQLLSLIDLLEEKDQKIDALTSKPDPKL